MSLNHQQEQGNHMIPQNQYYSPVVHSQGEEQRPRESSEKFIQQNNTSRQQTNQIPTGAPYFVQYPQPMPGNVQYPYVMQPAPQQQVQPQPSPSGNHCSWCATMKKWPLKKKFSALLISHLLILCAANLMYGFALTFYVSYGLITTVVGLVANRKKSEVLHGVFLGLTLTELALFGLGMLIAFPVWGGGISRRHTHHRHPESHKKNGIQRFRSIGTHLGLLESTRAPSNIAHKEHHKEHHNHHHKEEEKKEQHKRKNKHHRHHHHHRINIFVWVGYVLFASYGIMRIIAVVKSVKLIKSYRREREQQDNNNSEEELVEQQA